MGFNKVDIYDDVLEFIERGIENTAKGTKPFPRPNLDDKEMTGRFRCYCGLKNFLLELKKSHYCSEIEYYQKKIAQAKYLITKLNESQSAQKAVYEWRIKEFEIMIKGTIYN